MRRFRFSLALNLSPAPPPPPPSPPLLSTRASLLAHPKEQYTNFPSILKHPIINANMSGIEIAGLLAAIPSLIDVCIRFTELLRRKIKLFMNNESHSRLQGFIVDLTASGINDMLYFFKDVRDKLPPVFVKQLVDMTKILRNALEKAYDCFPDDSEAVKKKTSSKWKYALYDSKRIEDAAQELLTWKTRFFERAVIHLNFTFYPKYGLGTPSSSAGGISSQPEIESPTTPDERAESLTERLKRIRNSRRTLAGPLLLPEFSNERQIKIAESPLWISEASDAGELHLFEYRSYHGADSQHTEDLRTSVRDVARQLREVDSSTMHILQCEGFSDDYFAKKFVLQFRFPPKETNPRSLRALLADPCNEKLGKKHSLSDRVRLAQSIAAAVLYVHASGFVHKNIRPDNIIVFEPQLPATASVSDREACRFPIAIGQPYLAGYDGIRKEEAATLMVDTIEWHQRLYLPPERLRGKPQRTKFTWKHDVYSLGVVLLEIAMWENFADGKGRMGKHLKAATDPSVFLMSQAKQVPRLLGSIYGDAVLACLRMLRNEENGEVELLRDEDGVGLGTTFISEVMDKLEQINL